MCQAGRPEQVNKLRIVASADWSRKIKFGDVKMTKKNFISRFSFTVLLCVLITATALTFTACNDTKDDGPLSSGPSQTVTDTVTKIGEGTTVFDFTVIDIEGNEPKFEVSTDETTVGAALQKVGLIEGEDSEFGLYVKKVNGITADYDVDGTYWSFLINGEYASAGADTTEINTEDSYSFKVAK